MCLVAFYDPLAHATDPDNSNASGPIARYSPLITRLICKSLILLRVLFVFNFEKPAIL